MRRAMHLSFFTPVRQGYPGNFMKKSKVYLPNECRSIVKWFFDSLFPCLNFFGGDPYPISWIHVLVEWSARHHWGLGEQYQGKEDSTLKPQKLIFSSRLNCLLLRGNPLIKANNCTQLHKLVKSNWLLMMGYPLLRCSTVFLNGVGFELEYLGSDALDRSADPAWVFCLIRNSCRNSGSLIEN